MSGRRIVIDHSEPTAQELRDSQEFYESRWPYRGTEQSDSGAKSSDPDLTCGVTSPGTGQTGLDVHSFNRLMEGRDTP